MMDSRVCSMRFDIQGICNDLVYPSIKQVSVLDQVEVSQVFHCDGLLLCCVIEDNSSLLVWNPYLGQTRQILPRQKFGMYVTYALGYDKNHNHKILRIFQVPQNRTQPFGYIYMFEIYDLSSDSWRVLDATLDGDIHSHRRSVSLKGNVYFPAEKRVRKLDDEVDVFLLCFDFTTESFGPRLPLPLDFYSRDSFVSLSCVRDEQLALLYQGFNTIQTIDFCVTNHIDPSAVSWSKFLRLVSGFLVSSYGGTFFVDEEKKVAVVFDLDRCGRDCSEIRYQTAHIIGQDEYWKAVEFADAPNLATCPRTNYCVPLVSSSYVPSLVQLQIKKPVQRESNEVITD